MSDQAAVLQEAWWGGNRAAGGRPQPVHYVEWPRGRRAGYALCGKHIGTTKAGNATGITTAELGTAKSVRVTVCGPCQRALERRRPSAPVVPIRRNPGRKRVIS